MPGLGPNTSVPSNPAPTDPGYNAYNDVWNPISLNDPIPNPPNYTEADAETLGRLNTAQHTLQNATSLNQDAIDTLNIILRGLSGAVQAFWAGVIIAGGAATANGYAALMRGMQSNDPAPWMHDYGVTYNWITTTPSGIAGKPGNQDSDNDKGPAGIDYDPNQDVYDPEFSVYAPLPAVGDQTPTPSHDWWEDWTPEGHPSHPDTGASQSQRHGYRVSIASRVPRGSNSAFNRRYRKTSSLALPRRN